MSVIILDKDPAVGDWLLKQLTQIHISAVWLTTAADLLVEAERNAPTVCLIALRPPIGQALSLIADLAQEPRFSRTAFIVMGPDHYKQAAFEAGADDYLTTPPDVIELRKRVRLYLDRAALEAITTLLAPEAAKRTSLLEHITTLSQECQRHELILTYTAEAIALLAPDGTLLYANPAWNQLIGGPFDFPIGASGAWPPLNPTAQQAIANALDRRLPWHGEISVSLPDGDPLELSMNIQPAFDAAHHLAGFVISQRNITTWSTDASVRARFFADIAYHLRAPVTNIKMRQYLLSQTSDDQRMMHLDILESETAHLVHLVESMLELSRLDAGITQLNRQPLDLNRLVSEALTRYHLSASNKRVTLTIEQNASLPRVQADAGQMARALGILIENAIQHTPAGGHIQINLVPETWTGGSFNTVQVIDTGVGIAPDAQPHLFERFFRAERTIEAGITGVGLGLPIAEAIVALHDGHITVESEVGRGSTFTIWLPAS